MQKIALFAFNGEAMCFVHVLLYAVDFNEKGYSVEIVVEGAATRLIKDLADPGAPFAKLYADVREKGLIGAVCRACSSKMGSLEAAEEQELRLVGELNGHPSLERYLKEGFQVLTF